MPKQRQPIDSERNNLSSDKPDTSKREASPLELDDEDLQSSDFEDEDDMDY